MFLEPGALSQLTRINITSMQDRVRTQLPEEARPRYRVDVNVELLPVGRAELLSDQQLAEPSSVVAARVREARSRPARRLAGTSWRLNAEIPGSALRRSYRPAAGALAPLELAMDRGQISARGADRIIRMSWTLADLAGVDRPRLAKISASRGLWLGAGP